jgi:hypothetical protein
MIGFIGISLQLQSMTVWDSIHSLLDYECLLFHCDWLGSDRFWFTNHSLLVYEWMSSSLHGRLYIVAVTVENAYYLFMSAVNFLNVRWHETCPVPSPFPGIHVHGTVSCTQSFPRNGLHVTLYICMTVLNIFFIHEYVYFCVNCDSLR